MLRIVFANLQMAILAGGKMNKREFLAGACLGAAMLVAVLVPTGAQSAAQQNGDAN